MRGESSAVCLEQISFVQKVNFCLDNQKSRNEMFFHFSITFSYFLNCILFSTSGFEFSKNEKERMFFGAWFGFFPLSSQHFHYDGIRFPTGRAAL